MARRFDSLLRCPCCGGQPVVLVQRQGADYTVRVECSDCHVSTPGIVYARASGYDGARRLVALDCTALDMRRARETVAEIWNRRPEDSA